MGKHLQNPPDNIYAQFGDKLQRKREIGIHDSQKIIVFYWEGVNKHHCKMTVLICVGLRRFRERGGGG